MLAVGPLDIEWLQLAIAVLALVERLIQRLGNTMPAVVCQDQGWEISRVLGKVVLLDA